MYNKIYHPLSKKKINITSNEGIKLLQKYIKQVGGSKKIYIPDTYLKGLTKKEQKKRMKRIKEGNKSSHKDGKAYRDFETDFRNGVRIKTVPSKYTNQWKKYFPEATSLESKSKVTGVPLDLIEKVYNRGRAAWRTGHRPGANVEQWGYARVHSFLVKGKTFYTTDRKLAKEAMKRSNKAKKWFDSIIGLCDTKEGEKKYKWCQKAKLFFSED